MSRLRDLPIKRKLTVAILATTAVGVSVACIALAVFARFTSHQVIVRDMTVIADVVSRNTQAALAFQDDAEAARTLMALESETQVAAACIYSATGDRIAEYRRRGSNARFPSSRSADGAQFLNNSLVLFRPIKLHEKRIGTIYLQADLNEIQNRLYVFIGAGILALLGSMTVAAVIAARMQRAISGPILSLADTAHMISNRRDFGVRATPAGNDEIGQLTVAFNEMVTVIQERETALQKSNETLLDQIEERERAEGMAQAQLMRLELLHRITRAIGERQDLASIFDVVIRNLEDSLSLQFCCVGLYDSADCALTIMTVGLRSEARAKEMGLTRQSVIAIDDNGLSRCTRGELVYEPDVRQVPFALSQRMAGAGLLSLVIAPLVVENKVFGFVLAARQDDHAFSSLECEFLRQLSEHVALATNQVQLYDSLQQAYDDARQTQQTVMEHERLRVLGQMASGIAHDINNALFPVTLYSEYLLQKEPNLSPRARDYLSTILSAAGDVAQTVKRMGEFYRQRGTRGSLSAVSLNPIVEQAVKITRARWYDMPMQRGLVIEMRTDLAPDLPEVDGIDNEIREALTNLIFNAVDAMPQGGTLTLRTGRVPDSEHAKPQIFIDVIDTGVGMDDVTKRRCLEPFFTTKGERGTGLGLAMVYGILQRHGAQIEIESEPGQGTLFRLFFVVPSAVAPAEAIRAEIAVPLGLRLLLIDDDPVLMRALRITLEGDGHGITVANGGKEGIDAFRSAHESGEDFAAVITDLGMPHIDGRKVAETVKMMSPGTPVILLTGWGQRLSAEGELPPHIDYLLSKPPHLADLRGALAHCCSEAGQDASATGGQD